jgi:peptidoglycan/LPS O-acetylase OafA/YrhL
MQRDESIKLQSLQPNKLRYMVQLDGLRALAVFGVMIEHFVPDTYPLRAVLPWGGLGVKLFFVLSGFLITGILLRCRDLIDSRKQDAGFTVRQFYIRRLLRIAPIYYITIAVTALANIKPAREALIWNITYTSNIYYSLKGVWEGPISHLWSLSVEEQFYLVWPWLILFIPRKHILKTIIFTIAIGPLFRLIGSGISLNQIATGALTFSCLDSLGMGALLAFYSQDYERAELSRSKLCNFCLWVSIPLFIILQIVHLFYIEELSHTSVVEDTVTALLFTGLIGRAAEGFGGFVGTILELKPLVYFGKISYGIYIYHNFMYIILLYPSIFRFLGLPLPNSVLIQFFYKVVATLIVAILSWHLIEKPINNFKRFFEYKQQEQN